MARGGQWWIEVFPETNPFGSSVNFPRLKSDTIKPILTKISKRFQIKQRSSSRFGGDLKPTGLDP